MKKLMKAKLMRKTCGERWKVNESRLPRLIQVLREQDTLLELTLIKILFNIKRKYVDTRPTQILSVQNNAIYSAACVADKK